MIKNEKPAYVFLNMLNANYTVEKIPMKRTQNYNRSRWAYQREVLVNKMGVLGFNVQEMSTEEIKKLVEERTNES